MSDMLSLVHGSYTFLELTSEVAAIIIATFQNEEMKPREVKDLP